jgi:hypothetical protein
MRGSVHWAFCVRLDEQKWLWPSILHMMLRLVNGPAKALLVIGSYVVSLVQVGCAISISLLTFSVSVSFFTVSVCQKYCHMFSMGGAALNTKFALWALSRAYLHDFDIVHFLSFTFNTCHIFFLNVEIF